MKNKGLIIAMIILLTIIVFFLIMFLVVCLSGGNNLKIGLFNFGSKSKNIIYDNTFQLEEINNIDIKNNAGNIIFKESENDYIQVVLYGENGDEAKVTLNNGMLNIDYTKKARFALINFVTVKNDIIIYLPTNYENNIKIKNDYGDCELIDLENANVNIECNAGNVNVGKIKNATVKCDYGKIKIKEILNKCNLDADCGDIEVETISIKENSNIKADLGDVNINETNDIYIYANVVLGKTNINNNNNNRNSEVTLKINCDCGNITVNKLPLSCLENQI